MLRLIDEEVGFLIDHLLRKDRDHGVVFFKESMSSELLKMTNNLVAKKVLDTIGPIKNLNHKIFQLTPLGCQILMQRLGGILHEESQVIGHIRIIDKPGLFPTQWGLIVGKTSGYPIQVRSSRVHIIQPFVHNLLFQEIPFTIQTKKRKDPIRLVLIS